MATRTALRRRAALPDHREPDEWQRSLARLEAEARARQVDMTLGGAVELLRVPPWACACIGPPYCCRFSFDQARALQRAAHIAARQLADLRDRLDTP
jgi:hypothetical protein